MNHSNVSLPKYYIEARCRAVIDRIDQERKKRIRDLFKEKLSYYYSPGFFHGNALLALLIFPLDAFNNIAAWYRRARDGWPHDRPDETEEDLKDFVDLHLGDVEKSNTAFCYQGQYNIACMLLHASTINESESHLSVSLTDYQYISDPNHVMFAQ